MGTTLYRALILLLLVLLAPASAATQDFPSRPVRFVVPYAPRRQR